MSVLKLIRDTVVSWIKKNDITGKMNAVYTKIEEILSNYEVEKMVENIMDEVVEIMKSYQLREHIQSASNALKSIDIQVVLNKIMPHVNEFVNELNAFDFKQMVDNISVYFDRLTEKIRSFDYDTFAEELKQKVIELSRVPCFGKLNGGFSHLT